MLEATRALKDGPHVAAAAAITTICCCIAAALMQARQHSSCLKSESGCDASGTAITSVALVKLIPAVTAQC